MDITIEGFDKDVVLSSSRAGLFTSVNGFSFPNGTKISRVKILGDGFYDGFNAYDDYAWGFLLDARAAKERPLSDVVFYNNDDMDKALLFFSRFWE